MDLKNTHNVLRFFKRTSSFLAINLLIMLCFSCKDSDKTNREKNEYEKSPHDFMFMQRAYPSGEIETTAYAKAVAWKKEIVKYQKTNTAIWEFVGPENVGGRITDIEIPIDKATTYFVGAASGGIFKTTDAGNTWQPIFDDQEMLSIGDIEISKKNTDIIWAGTGEVNAGGGSLAYDGDGIYKSIDGGLTWETRGLPDVGSIGKIIIDPVNDDIVYVAAMGPLFRNDTNRGVYKTTDGGDTWNQVLFVSDITGVIDMAIHPTNGNVLYAASWERVRRPDNRSYGGATSGIYRSNDGGMNWEELTNGLPSNPNEKGRISIDISQSNPNVLYTRYADANGSIRGVFKTVDGGDTWQEVNSSQLTNVGFHWWFRGIYIDPKDENTLYNVDFVVEKSTDGGMNWQSAFPNVHVDQHALAFNTLVNDEVVLGNDGGFYKSADAGVSSTKDLSLPITQFYRFYVDPQNGNKIYGGTQDNGTQRTITGSTNDWHRIFGGDGFQPLVDASNTNTIYALSQRGNLGKSTDNGNSFANVTNGISGIDRNNWDTPVVFDPNNPETLYFGTDKIYKTTNGAQQWTAISTDLTNGSGSGNLAFGTITSIDVSPLNSEIIITGTDDGNVWITIDGGGTWDKISDTLPNRWITKVLTDRDNENTLYVTFSGYRFGEDNGHIYKSTDRGVTWSDIGTSLPDIPISDVVKDKHGVLFIGTDIGVFASSDEGVTWEAIGDNMPSVVITDLYIHENDEYLYAATYGRSAYKLDISSNVLSIEDINDKERVTIYPNPTSEQLKINGLESVDNLEIYSIQGQLVEIDIQWNLEQKLLNVQELSKGTYFLKIYSDKKTHTFKFIKR